MCNTNQPFSGKTAWFSSSVSKHKQRLWKKNGGELESVVYAQFIFSEDAEVPDTKRIYSFEAYLDEHLAVFHAKYISDCVKCNFNRKIPLGNYFLPPAEIQQLAKRQKKFAWEDGDVNKSSDSGSSEDEEQESSAKDKTEKNSPNENTRENISDEYIDINSLPLIAGILEDCVPMKNGFEVFRKT